MSELASVSPGRSVSRGIGWHRIRAMMLRHYYLLTSSWPRLLELVYWPLLTLISWGFLQTYVSGNSDFFARAGGAFIGAIILWDILFRGQLGFSMSFLEEMWSRNLGNLMMSPLTTLEFLLSMMIMSLIRLLVGVIPMVAVAFLFFDFNLLGLGFALVAFFCNLMLTSWAVAIVVSGLVLRNGMGAESLAWTIMFGLLPLVCVYYPVSVLPWPLQTIAWMLPPTYVFEGMRAALLDKTFRSDLMLEALAINAVLIVAANFIFAALLKSARRHGKLVQSGE
jgi:ABC-2 type transport system permease protein